MSLIFFVQLDDAVQIVTDTLVSDENRDPVIYKHKVHSFPHLDLVAVVTGFGNFGYQFFHHIEYTPEFRDIEHINETAQETLQAMYKGWRDYHAPKDIGHATMRLWGFPQGSNKIVQYTYRAMKDFAPERHEGKRDFAMQPPPQQFTTEAPESIEEVVALADKIRKENDDLRTEGPVAIGGDLMLTFMEPNRIVTQRIPRWNDHAEVQGRMPDSIRKPRHPVDHDS